MSAAGALFLDRDGTLVVERSDPLRRAQDVQLLPGAGAAVARANRAGWPVVLVTNQAALGRGLVSWEEYEDVRAALARALAQHGAHLDLDLCCPHHEREGLAPYRRACACRKPAPGLLFEAARRMGLERPRGWLVGDAARDVESARAAGVDSVLVLTGKGRSEWARLREQGGRLPRVADDLAAAVELVLQGR